MTRRNRHAPPHDRGATSGERVALAAVAAAGIVAFGRIHDLLGHDDAQAVANAHHVVVVETHLGMHVEPALNGWLVGHPALVALAVGAYRLYYVLVAGVLVWLLARHCRPGRPVRVLLLVLALALLGYWLFPLAPPRLALPGVVDVVARHDLLSGAGARSAPLPAGTATGNHNSAMPSMHVGWTAWCAYTLARRPGSPSGRRVDRRRPDVHAVWPWLLPAAMTAVVLSTGNHYVLDVAGSALALTLAVMIDAALTRLRPHRPLEDETSRD